MSGQSDVLRDVMQETGTSQTELSLISGVRQPSISQFLSGTSRPSDEQLDRLLSCMGVRLEVSRRHVEPSLTRSERRSWLLHRRLSSHLSTETFNEWLPRMRNNLERVRTVTQGQPHERNMDEWERLLSSGNVNLIKRTLTGLSRHDIEMREVSPMTGLLPNEERLNVLQMDAA